MNEPFLLINKKNGGIRRIEQSARDRGYACLRWQAYARKLGLGLSIDLGDPSVRTCQDRRRIISVVEGSIDLCCFLAKKK